MPSKRKTKHSTVIPIPTPQRSPLHTLTGAGNLKTKQNFMKHKNLGPTKLKLQLFANVAQKSEV